MESVLGRETTDDDKIRFLNFLKKQETNGNYFTRAMNISVSVSTSASSPAMGSQAENEESGT